MKAFWITSLWLGIMLFVIWGSHASSRSVNNEIAGHEAANKTSVPHDDSVDREARPPVVHDPTRNNREDALRGQGLYPCADCHNLLIPNPMSRDKFAKPHESISLLHSGSMSCLTCHSKDRRNQLVLMDGTEVSFNESHKVCGGCHGIEYRDWLHGAHGLRSGYWNGKKDAWLCVRCHHPHQPEFPSMDALPPPSTRFDAEDDH